MWPEIKKESLRVEKLSAVEARGLSLNYGSSGRQEAHIPVALGLPTTTLEDRYEWSFPHCIDKLSPHTWKAIQALLMGPIKSPPRYERELLVEHLIISEHHIDCRGYMREEMGLRAAVEEVSGSPGGRAGGGVGRSG
ncbi:uncharacterized protein A4U43_UnF5160 [Asparagus officinalis]|uniref:Uncharacterized protein n=1 Tax=Asparagus officinalis TaxID=4686 RepID=A0A1R3L6T1_ASPOF|nr:uncharacterized protein A4U43_UnF5160 [Asparagus officinalis]